MKICLLVSSMGAGGAERVAATLSNGWVSRGHGVTLVVTYSNKGTCAYQLDPRVELVYLSDHVTQETNNTFVKILRFFALRKIIKERGPTVIVSFLTNVNVAAIAVSFGLALPVVVAERSHPPKMPTDWRLAHLRKLTYPFAATVVMLTTMGLQWVNTNIRTTRVAVIPNPVNFPLPAIPPLSRPTDFFSGERKLVLSVGRLVPGKQVDHLIRAFSKIASMHSQWDLAIVGEGPSSAELMALAERLQLSPRIKFIGQAGNVGDWYARADLFVLSSQFEGFPNTLVEAMAYGCAAVSYDCDTGPRDIITSGIDGILIPPDGGEQALAVTISSLMGNDGERIRMAKAAESVRVRFALSQILDLWDLVFKPLLN